MLLECELSRWSCLSLLGYNEQGLSLPLLRSTHGTIVSLEFMMMISLEVQLDYLHRGT